MPRPDFEREWRASLENNTAATIVNSGGVSEENARSFSDLASLVPRMELRFNSAYKRRIQYR